MVLYLLLPHPLSFASNDAFRPILPYTPLSSMHFDGGGVPFPVNSIMSVGCIDSCAAGDVKQTSFESINNGLLLSPIATSEDSLRRALAEKQSTIDASGNAIRQLKSSGAAKSEIDDAVKALDAFKLEKTSIETQLKASISGDASFSLKFDFIYCSF
ncbi:hypothetical protein L2E82_14030 [Cichorium intybus]|uniref:Uncharacterized protein n=1 Tax=Cichorium intybus TaxID=13427 RepID=A0ACB9EZG9_CICIN|nr:hypothetical protein L2E82_14030 [Cichorium intybus]